MYNVRFIFYIIVTIIPLAAADDALALSRAKVPFVVRNYMASEFAQHAKEAEDCAHESHGAFTPGVTLLYYTELPIGGWLVGYRLGVEISTPVNRAVVLDSRGSQRFVLPDEFAGESAIIVQVGRGEWAVAMCWDMARHRDGYVVLFTLEPRPHELWRYEDNGNEHWESTAFFRPCSAGKDAEIEVERHVLADDGRVRRTDLIVYHFDHANGHFEGGTSIDRPTFEAAKAKTIELGGDSLSQWGPPIEGPPRAVSSP